MVYISAQLNIMKEKQKHSENVEYSAPCFHCTEALLLVLNSFTVYKKYIYVPDEGNPLLTGCVTVSEMFGSKSMPLMDRENVYHLKGKREQRAAVWKITA